MIVDDSRTQTVKRDIPVYVTSEPRDSEWGQPSASHYVFVVVGNRLRGQPISDVYLPLTPSDISPVGSGLAAEFEAWDAASDEALANFEASLD